MTTYAWNHDQSELTAIWPTGIGHVCQVVGTAGLHEDTIDIASELAEFMGLLSAILWQPADSVAEDADEADDEATYNAETLSDVRRMILEPELNPIGQVHFNDKRLDYANAVGTYLFRLGDGELARDVAEEIEAELKAIEQASLGDLTGRAAQAICLPGRPINPMQVATAHSLLAKRPGGGPDIYRLVEAPSAAVAAIYWLCAAIANATEAGGAETEEELAAEAADFEEFLHAMTHYDPNLQALLVMATLTILVGHYDEREVIAGLLDDSSYALTPSALLRDILAFTAAVVRFSIEGESLVWYDDGTLTSAGRPLVHPLEGAHWDAKDFDDDSSEHHDGTNPVWDLVALAQNQLFLTEVRDLVMASETATY